jgi:hypothetical protein
VRWATARGPFRGRQHKAIIQPDGTIRFRGRVFNSPSLAARTATHRAMNGWHCQMYEAAPRRWAKLAQLRQA